MPSLSLKFSTSSYYACLAFTTLSSSVLPAVVMGFRAITLAVVSNPIGIAVAGLITGATLVIANWKKVKSFFTGFWENQL